MDRTVDDTLRELVVLAKKQEEQKKPTDDPNILIERQFLESLGKENEHDSKIGRNEQGDVEGRQNTWYAR